MTIQFPSKPFPKQWVELLTHVYNKLNKLSEHTTLSERDEYKKSSLVYCLTFKLPEKDVQLTISQDYVLIYFNDFEGRALPIKIPIEDWVDYLDISLPNQLMSFEVKGKKLRFTIVKNLIEDITQFCIEIAEYRYSQPPKTTLKIVLS